MVLWFSSTSQPFKTNAGCSAEMNKNLANLMEDIELCKCKYCSCQNGYLWQVK